MRRRDTDYPWGMSDADSENVDRLIEERWGTEALGELGGADSAGDRAYLSLGGQGDTDVVQPSGGGPLPTLEQCDGRRSVLPAIRVPTLVLHRKDVAMTTIDHGRYIADHIPGARFVKSREPHLALQQAECADPQPHRGVPDGRSPTAESDRALAAVLFTDIVGSTERASALGDRRWRALLETHDGVARTIIEQHRGRLVKTTGDGVLATFDGPGRAIRCAFALRDALDPLGIETRAGLHTGEIELREGDVGGIGVHVAARVLDRAGAGELGFGRRPASRDWIGPDLRRSRGTRAQGHPRNLATVRRGGLTGRSVCAADTPGDLGTPIPPA